MLEVKNDIEIFNDGKPTSMFIGGSSKAGKSVLELYIYNKYYNNSDWINVLFTYSEQNKIYTRNNNLMIRCEYSNKDSAMIEAAKYINVHTNNKYNFMFMFDDCIDIKYSQMVNRLVCVYRNSGISSIISCQYIKMLSKANRANVNSIALFRFNEDEVVEDVIRMYLKSYFIKILGRGTKMDDMVEYYKISTLDHQFFYLVPSLQSLTLHKLKI